MSDYIDKAISFLDGIDLDEFAKNFIELEEVEQEFQRQALESSDFTSQLDDVLSKDLVEVSQLTHDLQWEFYWSNYSQPSKHFSKIQIDTLKTLTASYKNSLKMILEDQQSKQDDIQNSLQES